MDGQAKRTDVARYVANGSLAYPNVVAIVLEFLELYATAVGEPLRGTPTILLFDPAGKLRAPNVVTLRPEALDACLRLQTTPPD